MESFGNENGNGRLRRLFTNRDHVIQTILLMLPLVGIIGGIIALYISLRTELSISQENVKGLQTEINEIRLDEKSASQESRNSLTLIQALLTKLQIDFGVESGLQVFRSQQRRK
jgi:uncharacterized membrane protein (DUF106 family)